jgi:group I intron endonuclease
MDLKVPNIMEPQSSLIIYKTTNLINGKIYIGQDSNNNPNYYGSGLFLKRAVRKYGKINFRKEILAECGSKEMLNELEIFFIALYRKKFGKETLYNISAGGDGNKGLSHTEASKRIIGLKSKGRCIGYKHTDEAKEKISKSKIGSSNPMFGKFGKLCPSYGIKHSAERKQKNRENQPTYIPIDLDKLKELRELGYTQKRLAEYFKCSRGVIERRLRVLNER